MIRLLTALLFAASAASAQTANPEAVQQGKAVYDKNCTACHGADAGAGDRAPAIVAVGAVSMRGERSDAQLTVIIKDGIPGTAMPAWGARLPGDELAKLVAYIHALRGTALDSPLPGDAVHGEAVFWGKGNCGACHAISGRGSVIGPDLGNIAAIRKSVAISNALTKAEHRVYGDGGVHLPMIPPTDYTPVHAVTRSGQGIDGVMRNQDAWSVQLMDRDGRLHSLARSELKSLTIKPGSLMPTDYDKRLSADEFKDLMAFLTRQGSKPWPAAKDAE